MWADDVPEDVKRHRNNEMLDLQNQISEEDNADLIGSTFEVLVEGISKSAKKAQAADDSFVPQHSHEDAASGPTQLVGRTRCDRIVVFDGNPRLAGSLVDVAVQGCTATTLLGGIVTHERQSVGLSLPIMS